MVARGRVTRMQAAYLGVEEAWDLVAQLREGERPLLVAVTGTDGLGSRLAGLTGRLQSQLRRIK